MCVSCDIISCDDKSDICDIFVCAEQCLTCVTNFMSSRGGNVTYMTICDRIQCDAVYKPMTLF